MGLSSFNRDVLNQIIDNMVKDIRPVVDFARKQELRILLKDRDGSDFSLGVAVAEIYMPFLIGFKRRNGRSVNQEERAELFNVLGQRIHEIKEAIFKCG